MVRFVKGTATSQDLESHAEGNFRHAFAVAGILEEVESFYETVLACVRHVDTSLNGHVQGPTHTSSLNGAWTTQHQNMFSKASVQKWLLATSPERAALHHLHAQCCHGSQPLSARRSALLLWPSIGKTCDLEMNPFVVISCDR